MEFGRVTRHPATKTAGKKDGGQEAEWGKDERGKEGKLPFDVLPPSPQASTFARGFHLRQRLPPSPEAMADKMAGQAG